uniref:Uncharacterized protein n=1 Tax=uncultured Sphingobacterium sp. EB080_L08E11 TaxID=710992 RepID=E0Y0V4_9SPHI|nr:hypothetical protein [uncultured Sphingobacterium sp. EB080_L08E11]
MDDYGPNLCLVFIALFVKCHAYLGSVAMIIFKLFRYPISKSRTVSPVGILWSARKTTTACSPSVNFRASAIRRCSTWSYPTMVPFTSNSNASFTVSVMFFFLTVWAPLFGKTISSALEVTRVEARIKKMSNRKTKSVMDDMLTSALTLLLLRKFIAFFLGRFVQ